MVEKSQDWLLHIYTRGDKMEIKEYDVVRLKDGREGVVLEILESGSVFLLEICSDHGKTLDMPFVKKEDIEKIVFSADGGKQIKE